MTEESVLKRLDDIIVNGLLKYIEEINRKYNDGIILEPFTCTNITEKIPALPYVVLKLVETEFSEKDRIIEEEKITVSLEIKLCERKDNWIRISRYIEAVQAASDEIKINKKKNNTLELVIGQ